MAETTITLNGDESVSTFGGEETLFHEYGINFGGEMNINNLSPTQAIQLVCVLGDHLLLNGHKFKIVDTNEQDQKQKLVCEK